MYSQKVEKEYCDDKTSDKTTRNRVMSKPPSGRVSNSANNSATQTRDPENVLRRSDLMWSRIKRKRTRADSGGRHKVNASAHCRAHFEI